MGTKQALGEKTHCQIWSISLNDDIEKPKVSVCVITYNQEKYISQCLQSILDQESEFDFEVVVGDDCSSDGTPEIVKEFARKYPKIIKPIFQTENTGGTKNYLDVHAAACGKYIAHVDGDDYALPEKLKKQVAVLDSNPDVSMVVHGSNILDEKTNKFILPVTRFYGHRIETVEFLLLNLPYFAHSSKMYRRDTKEDFVFKGEELIDCYFHIFHASKGSIYLIPEELIVYRQNIGLSSQDNYSGNSPKKHSVRNIRNQRTNEALHKAINSADRFGISKSLIEQSHAQAELTNAISLLQMGLYVDYQHSIARSISYKKISTLQYSLYLFSNYPAFTLSTLEIARWLISKLTKKRWLGRDREEMKCEKP